MQNLSRTACAKEACGSEQARQGWLLLHVPAAFCGRYSDACGHCLASDEVPVTFAKLKPLSNVQTFKANMITFALPLFSVELANMCVLHAIILT
jgi:hypothetical protein